jgi:hypothetical protein
LAFVLVASRLRATSAAAAAPNSRTIGGAGTGVPPVELPVEPPLLLELDDVLLLVDEDVDELDDPPKLDDPPVAPEEVLDEPLEPELPPVDPP